MKILFPDAICQCRHFLGVQGGRGHAGVLNAPCTQPDCECKAFQEDAYRPMPTEL